MLVSHLSFAQKFERKEAVSRTLHTDVRLVSALICAITRIQRVQEDVDWENVSKYLSSIDEIQLVGKV